MNTFLYRKIVTPRKLKLSYTSPPICEGDFSATGASELSLLPIYKKGGPTGLIMDWIGHWRLSWNRYPGALCYSVYKLSFSEWIIVAECIFDPYLDLDVFGDGTYMVTVITDDGESDGSDAITTGTPPTPPVPPCPPETGDPCPAGPTAFDITVEYAEHPDDPVNWPDADEHNPVLWDEIEFVPDHNWPDPMDATKRAFELPGDYPPGDYHIRYVSGFEEGTVTGWCLNPTDYAGNIAVYYAGDDEHRGIVMGELALINNMRDVDNSPPPPWAADIDYGAGGVSGLCAVNLPLVQAACNAWFNPAGYARVWRSETTHSNTGGPIRFVWDTVAMGNFDEVPGYPLMLRLLQINGLIQQARSLQVQSWWAIGTAFGVAVSSNWDGSFNDRSDYSSITCTWTEPANGGFGGASIYYTQLHPTAANGCGWILDIYEGATLIWRGYKTVGEQGYGMYYRAAGYTLGLPCIYVENKEYWDYPV